MKRADASYHKVFQYNGMQIEEFHWWKDSELKLGWCLVDLPDLPGITAVAHAGCFESVTSSHHGDVTFTPDMNVTDEMIIELARRRVKDMFTDYYKDGTTVGVA